MQCPDFKAAAGMSLAIMASLFSSFSYAHGDVGPHGEHQPGQRGSHFSHDSLGHGRSQLHFDGPGALTRSNSLHYGAFGRFPGQAIYREPSYLTQYGQRYNYNFSGRRLAAADKSGWLLLSARRPEAALRFFRRQSQDNPRQGKIAVGYGLSAALTGDNNRAIWALRRALDSDPYSIPNVKLDAVARDQLQYLGGNYEVTMNGEGSQPVQQADSAFMLAAVGYFIGDLAAARRGVNQALVVGDNLPSTRQLEQLILQAEYNRYGYRPLPVAAVAPSPIETVGAIAD